ncbi:hypothetical protein F5Y18DRAFT_404683 [Xylariaceae sp. FL1019]|nr:hypothetical protein F5Y18DRAFT_404683 [Xylariaceae sp. FL1019]
MIASYLLPLMLAAIHLSDAVCYDVNGAENEYLCVNLSFPLAQGSNTGFPGLPVPCNVSERISVCCSATDFCLDNGLCLDAGGDNLINVQGCTSPAWDSPCKKYCPDMVFFNYYQDLALCKTNDRTSGEYCCGQNASCCSQTDSFYYTIPLFQSVYRAGGTSTLSSSQTSSITSASNVPPSSITSSQASVPSSPANNGASQNNDSLKLGLGIGLGVGLGLLAAAIAFLAWEVRKRNTSHIHGQQPNESPSDRPLSVVSLGGRQKADQQPPHELHTDLIQRELPADLQHSLI